MIWNDVFVSAFAVKMHNEFPGVMECSLQFLASVNCSILFVFIGLNC